MGWAAALQGSPPHRHNQQAPTRQQTANKVFVSALDDAGHAVLDLNPDDFEITAEGHGVQVTSVAPATSEPKRLGILLDVSGSETKTAASEDPDALSSFVQTQMRPRDFTFVATFADFPTVVGDWSDFPQEVGLHVREALRAPRHAGSALFDAISWTCDKKMGLTEGNKVLLVISDMQDNESRNGEAPAVARALGTNVSVFVLLEKGESAWPKKWAVGRALQVATEISGTTGGLEVDAKDENAFRKGLDEISQALSGRYVLQLAPASLSTSPGFHPIKVTCSRKGVRLLAPSSYFVAKN